MRLPCPRLSHETEHSTSPCQYTKRPVIHLHRRYIAPEGITTSLADIPSPVRRRPESQHPRSHAFKCETWQSGHILLGSSRPAIRPTCRACHPWLWHGCGGYLCWVVLSLRRREDDTSELSRDRRSVNLYQVSRRCSACEFVKNLPPSVARLCHSGVSRNPVG
jgi:hypothetical protein